MPDIGSAASKSVHAKMGRVSQIEHTPCLCKDLQAGWVLMVRRTFRLLLLASIWNRLWTRPAVHCLPLLQMHAEMSVLQTATTLEQWCSTSLQESVWLALRNRTAICSQARGKASLQLLFECVT